MTSVSNVAVIRPPITTVAKGFCTSAPADVEIAIGRNPSEATAAVMMTGRRRVRNPFSTRSVMSVIPSFSRRLNSAISTMPFNTATPNNAMKPTPADMEKFMSRSQSANTPPIAAQWNC